MNKLIKKLKSKVYSQKLMMKDRYKLKIVHLNNTKIKFK